MLYLQTTFPSFHFETIQIGKMLKPEKWQSTFDSNGKIFGFRKVLKLIILGVCQMCFYSRFPSSTSAVLLQIYAHTRVINLWLNLCSADLCTCNLDTNSNAL